MSGWYILTLITGGGVTCMVNVLYLAFMTGMWLIIFILLINVVGVEELFRKLQLVCCCTSFDFEKPSPIQFACIFVIYVDTPGLKYVIIQLI